MLIYSGPVMTGETYAFKIRSAGNDDNDQGSENPTLKGSVIAVLRTTDRDFTSVHTEDDCIVYSFLVAVSGYLLIIWRDLALHQTVIVSFFIKGGSKKDKKANNSEENALYTLLLQIIIGMEIKCLSVFRCLNENKSTVTLENKLRRMTKRNYT